MAKSRHNRNQTFKKTATVNVVICKRPTDTDDNPQKAAQIK